MSNKFLPIYISNARYESQKLLPALLQGNANYQDVLVFCRNHRLIGIGSLLLLCDTEVFQAHLFRSGRAFLELVASVEGSWPMALSRAAPFLDALAVLDLDGARQMALLAPRSRRVDTEYEEDFLYIRFLMDFGLLGWPEDRVRPLLVRFEEVLQGSEEPRLDVCKALLARDSVAFETAFLHFLHEDSARLARLHSQGRLTKEFWSTEANLSVEGLSLVVLAKHLGLTVRADYPRIPSIAQCNQPPNELPSAWRSEE